MITVKNNSGYVIVTPGEWQDALAQTLIEANATEATPLKLGNVQFWRADGGTCYDLPSSQWDAAGVSNDLCEAILSQRESEVAS